VNAWSASSDPDLRRFRGKGAQVLIRTFLETLRSLAVPGALLLLSALPACQIPGDASTGTGSGKSGMITAINRALNSGDCSTAITRVETLYNSADSDDQIRRLRAASHGCRTGLGFFEKLDALANADLMNNGPWRAITLAFPSILGDNKVESSFFASDALQSWLKPDVVVFNPYRLTFDPYNPGSLRAADLELDSNIYLVMISMATIGTLHNRYGAPNAVGAPTKTLPWSTLARMDEEGCGYVSAILNMKDALVEVGDAVSQMSNVLSSVLVASLGFDAACQAGCTACGLSCSGCPATLRHRSVCSRTLPSTVDVEACAAAGLVGNVMNNVTVGWR
jgi:hypothetical protein